jgi:hypothetical protein
MLMQIAERAITVPQLFIQALLGGFSRQECRSAEGVEEKLDKSAELVVC